MHANSGVTNPVGAGAAAQGGRAPAGQQGMGRSGAGPPRIRSVAMAEASKGPADADGFVTVGAASGLRTMQPCGAAAQGQAGTASGGGEGPRAQAAARASAAGPVATEAGGGTDAWGQPMGAGDGGDDHAMRIDDEVEADGGGQADGAEQLPSEDVLRGYWEAAKELLAFAKRQGHPEDHPVRRSAQRQVDEAYAEWRAAAPPKAVHARMGWAEEALRRARRAQEKAENELEELDRQYEYERQQKVQALEEAQERTRARAQKLADISKEAAEEYQGDAADMEGSLLRGTFATIDSQVGPALEAVLAKMERGSEQHTILQQALHTVATMHAALGVAAGGPAADFFDMAAGDGDAEATAASPAVQGDVSEAPAVAMDTAATRAPRWLEPKRGGEPDPASSTGAQPPRWKKNRADNGETNQPAAPSGSASGAAEGPGGAPATPPAADARNGDFEQRREHIVSQACAEGIDVPADYLRQLCPEALEEWAAEHLL